MAQAVRAAHEGERVVTLEQLAREPTTDVVTAARVLMPGCSRSAAYAMARRGEIPTLRLGRQLRVPVPQLLALLGIEPNAKTAAPARATAFNNHGVRRGQPSTA